VEFIIIFTDISDFFKFHLNLSFTAPQVEQALDDVISTQSHCPAKEAMGYDYRD